MAKTPGTIRVTNDELAQQIEDAGKRLIELSMTLRSGFDVPVTYSKPEHEHDYYAVQFSWGGYVECECGYRPSEAEFPSTIRPVVPEGEQQ
jgi:hypothetical protein